MTTTATIEEFTFAGSDYTLEIDLDFDVSRYDPGDYFNPPEGGEVEVTEATVTSVMGEDGEEIVGVLEEQVVAEFQKKFKNGAFDDRFVELCQDTANNEPDYAGDAERD